MILSGYSNNLRQCFSACVGRHCHVRSSLPERRFHLLEQLKFLIEYQILENKKALLIRNGEETPKRIAELEKEFGQYEAEYLAKKADHEHAKEMHRSLEQAISDLEAKIARSKRRMSEVKTNKEYQAINKEIEEYKKEISARESEILEVMQNIESLSNEVLELEKALEKRKEKLQEDLKVLQAEMDHLKERLDRLEASQKEVEAKLQPDLLRRSHFLFKKQAGIAVAPVENGVCQVCHLNIPPQKFIELQRDETIMSCPHCHRFVYWPGHECYCLSEDDYGDV